MNPDVRLGELMLYIAKKCQTHEKFGGTKLNKILWYSDFCSYGQTGKPITGAEYIKLEYGPVPKRLLPIREQLEHKKAAVIQKTDFLGMEQQRLVALRDADLKIFRADEIALVDKVIELFRDHSAEQVSDFSHNRIWRIAGTKQPIPYEAVFVSDENANQADALRAQELIKEHSWAV